jgi:beta-glucosidase-like glycosyl hydrolase
MSFADFKKDHLHPVMKASEVEKAEMKELTTALGEKTTAKPFVVEKELTEALSPEKKKRVIKVKNKMEKAVEEPKKEEPKKAVKIPRKESDAIHVKTVDELKNAFVLMGLSEEVASRRAEEHRSQIKYGFHIWKTAKRINMKRGYSE